MAVFSKPRSRWITGLIVLIFAIILALPDDVASERLDFDHAGNTLAGRLVLPDTAGPHPTVIFVHGDGASPWDAHGYYQPFITAFNKVGFAVYAWDKPGVGGSQGNWLAQSMQDRADEVIAAATALKEDPRIASGKIGLMGFSQAGWVTPKAAAQSDFAFLVSVSGAINWLEQSEYMTKNRLIQEGAPDSEIRSALVFDDLLVRLMKKDATYKQFQMAMENAPWCCRDAMSEERWNFVKANFTSDARDDLRRIDTPVLGIFGERDLNVDAHQSAQVYNEILQRRNAQNRTILLENADHLLLKAHSDRLVSGGLAMILHWLNVVTNGAGAFAQNAPDLIVNWVTSLEGMTTAS
ncbi:MAG: alpha/beta fold hydrolase [Pelagimonas sp.]|jgi:pimeloyl-ACP methyl ester carboxylesterase|nr:alpha/beta fold hydrolase [Pelagimonas sp.]